MKAKSYRKKPVEIEALQWDGGNRPDMYLFITGRDWTPQARDLIYMHLFKPNGDLVIKTLEGDHLARIGDYIIKGVEGEFYPCKPEIFKKTYDEV